MAEIIEQQPDSFRYARIVKIWLLMGLVMLVIQVVVGGITRLTGSGLSITEWDIVSGTLPPMTDSSWEQEFDLYKDSPQYREINAGMEMGSVFESGTFKFIYFWEWVHRLWARMMGLVFLFPFIFFWVRGYFDRMLKSRLLCVFALAGLAASFGWIMVASGLVERPWVNAYKLAVHLGIAFATYGVLLWTYYNTIAKKDSVGQFGLSLRFRKLAMWFTMLVCCQIFLGGIMSGMKAAVAFPTWPDMNGAVLPVALLDREAWSWQNVNYYDQSLFMPALIQFLHRSLAYAVVFYAAVMVARMWNCSAVGVRKGLYVLGGLVIVQVSLGILTVINSQSSVPVGYGVWHQFTALMLLTSALWFNHRFSVQRSRR